MLLGFYVVTMLGTMTRGFQRIDFVPVLRSPININRRFISTTVSLASEAQAQEQTKLPKDVENRLTLLLHSLSINHSKTFANPEDLDTITNIANLRGAHEKFGKSAVKTFNTFVLKGGGVGGRGLEEEGARRTAQQIEFLFRRHQASISEIFRNSDDEDGDSEALTRPQYPLAVVLDNLRSSTNVGSIIRTLSFFSVPRLIPVGITPSPHSVGREAVVKSSLGAENDVDCWTRYDTLEDAVGALRNEGYRIVAFETVEGAEKLNDFSFFEQGNDNDDDDDNDNDNDDNDDELS